ncbi:MAG: hypothetical protein AABY22_11010 [Nanoarchaeota archaeon]
MIGKKGFQKGYIPWNKGLTKNTSEKIYNCSEKLKGVKRPTISERMKDHKYNPNYNSESRKKITDTFHRNGIFHKLKYACSMISPEKRKETGKKIKESNIKNGTYEKLRQRQLINNSNKYVRNPSKPQLKLFQNKVNIYGKDKVFLNYKVPKLNGGFIYLDVAVPNLMLDFEYDSKYWHSKDRRLNDNDRDNYLKNLGWSIVRIIGN